VRNVRSGEPLDVRYLGRRRRADVQVHTDEASVLRLYDIICRDNRQFAGFNLVGLDDAGNPSPEDMRACWEGGARVLELRVRD
jgi:hypothetical protein